MNNYRKQRQKFQTTTIRCKSAKFHHTMQINFTEYQIICKVMSLYIYGRIKSVPHQSSGSTNTIFFFFPNFFLEEVQNKNWGGGGGRVFFFFFLSVTFCSFLYLVAVLFVKINDKSCRKVMQRKTSKKKYINIFIQGFLINRERLSKQKQA